MFKTAEELKEFVIWAKKEGLKNFRSPAFSFEISDLALLSLVKNPEEDSADLLERARLEQEMEKSEFEDLLYHSTKSR